jgi:hypothetical protein
MGIPAHDMRVTGFQPVPMGKDAHATGEHGQGCPSYYAL